MNGPMIVGSGGMTSSPFGFAFDVASRASSMLVLMPAETVQPVFCKMSARSFATRSTGCGSPVRSRYASSQLTACTRGVTRVNSRKIAFETAVIRSKSYGRTTRPGQSAAAEPVVIPAWMP